MERNNESSGGDFILLRFSDVKLEMVLFFVNMIFYFHYCWQLTIIFLSLVDPQLHTPMYFFLSNLSLLDLCYTTSSIPQMLVNLWGPYKTITYVGCVIQLFAFLSVGGISAFYSLSWPMTALRLLCKHIQYTRPSCTRSCAYSWQPSHGLVGLPTPSSVTLTMSLGRCGHRTSTTLCV